MDESTLKGLETALNVNPDNEPLLKLVLEACRANQAWARGLEHLRAVPKRRFFATSTRAGSA